MGSSEGRVILGIILVCVGLIGKWLFKTYEQTEMKKILKKQKGKKQPLKKDDIERQVYKLYKQNLITKKEFEIFEANKHKVLN